MKPSVILITIVAVMTVGCTAATQRPTTAPDDKPYRFESDGQVPPPNVASMRAEVDRVDVFEEAPVESGALVVEGVETVEDLRVEDVADSGGAGFRVQVFASGDPDAAKGLEGEVEARLGVAAYVEHLDGMYKVRVGDCRTRAEAEALRRRCWLAGYGDAWIVASRINVNGAPPAPTGSGE